MAADPLAPAALAVTVVEPGRRAPAIPPLLKLTTFDGNELHAAPAVTSSVNPFLKWAIARNCWLPSMPMDATFGITSRDAIGPGRTITAAPPMTPPCDAVMIAVPLELPKVDPCTPTPATVASTEFHCAEAVRSCVEPSLNVPVAVSCSFPPIATADQPGVTAMDTTI